MVVNISQISGHSSAGRHTKKKCIASLQKAFINPLELYGLFFYDGWMCFLGFQKLSLLFNPIIKLGYFLI